MSSTVDTRVVEMKFDNRQFEQGVNESRKSLNELDKSLQKMNGSSLNGLSEASRKIDLSNLNSSVESVSKRFSTMGIVGMTVIQDITHSVLNLGKSMLTAIPNQIKNGGWTRAMNIENAKFQLEGLGYTWDKVGKQINNAVAGTAYGLDSAAKAAGSLVASGIAIEGEGDRLEQALKGISGVAAQTNSSYDDIARIFTTVAGNGRLMGEQLNQLSSRGLNAAATLGKVLGKSESEVRKMVSQGQIDFQTFSDAMNKAFGEHAFEANNTFQGALANMKAALSKIGANFAEPIIQQTIPVFNALRESINKAKTEIEVFAKFDPTVQATYVKQIGDAKGELEKLKTALNEGKISLGEYDLKASAVNKTIHSLGNEWYNAMSPFERFTRTASKFAVDVINKVDWKFLNGFGNGLVNIVKGVASYIKPIAEAFKEIFHIDGNGILVKISNGFEKLTKHLILNKNAMEYLKISMKGIFSVFELVGSVIHEILGLIPGLDSGTFSLAEQILKITAIIGSLLSYGVRLIKDNNLIIIAIDKIKMGVGLLISLLAAGIITIIDVVSKIVKLFTSGDIKQLPAKMAEIGKYIISGLQSGILNGLKNNSFLTTVKLIASNVINTVCSIFDIHSPSRVFIWIGSMILAGLVIGLLQLDPVQNALQTIGSIIIDFFVNIADKVVNSKFFETVKKGFTNVIDVLKKAGKSLVEFSKSFAIWVSNIDIGTVIAIGFTAAIVGMSLQMLKFLGTFSDLAKATTSFLSTVKNRGILGIIFGKNDKKKDYGKIIEIAGSITVLALAVKMLSDVPYLNLMGVVEVIGYLSAILLAMAGAITACQKVLGKDGKSLESLGLVFVEITGSILGMILALKLLEQINFTDIKDVVKTIGVLAVIITTLAGTAALLQKFANKLEIGALTLIGIATSIYIMASAVKKLKDISTEVSLETLAYFLGVVTGVLAISAVMKKVSGNGTAFLGLVAAAFALKLALPMIATAFANKDVKGLGKNISDFIEGLGILGSVGTLATLAAVIAAAIALSKIGTEIGIGIAAVAGSIALLIYVTNKIKEVDWKSTLASIAIMGTVCFGLYELLKALSKIGGENQVASKTILSLAAFMIPLTGFFITVTALSVVLSKIIQNGGAKNLWAGVAVIAALTALVDSVIACSTLMKDVNAGSMFAVVIGLISLIGELIALSLLMNKHGLQILEALGIMASIMVSFGAMMRLTLKNTDVSKTKLLAMATALGVLITIGIELYELSTINDWVSVAAASTSIIACLLAYSYVIKEIGQKGLSFRQEKWQAMILGLIAIGEIGASLAVIVGLSDNWYDALAVSGAITLCLAAYSGMLISISKLSGNMTENRLSGMKYGIAALISIGASLAVVSMNDWNSIATATGGMVISLVALVGALEIISKSNIDTGKAASLAIASISIIEIAAALKLAGETVDWNTVLGISATLVTLSAALGVLAEVGSSNNTGLALAGASLILLAFGLSALGDSIAKIASQDYNSINSAFTGLIITIVAMSVALGLLSTALKSVPEGAALAVIVLLAMSAVLETMSHYIDSTSKLTDAIVQLIGAMANFLPILYTFCKDVIPLLASKLIEIEKAKFVLKELAEGLIIIGLSGIALKEGASGLIIGATGISNIADGINKFQSINISKLASELRNIVKPFIELGTGGVVMITGAVGVTAFAIATNVLTKSLATFSMVVNSDLLNSMKTLPSRMSVCGQYTVAGFVEGLTSKSGLSNIAKAASGIGNLVEQTIRTVLQIHSPSWKTEVLGAFTTAGYALGLQDNKIWKGIHDGLAKLLKVDVEQPFADTASNVSKMLSDMLSGMTDFDHMMAQYNTGKYKHDPKTGGLSNLEDISRVNQAKKNGGGFLGGMLADISPNLDDILGDVASSFNDIGGAAGGASGGVDKLTNSMTDLSSIFERFKAGEKAKSMTELISNVASHITGTFEWAQNMVLAKSKGFNSIVLEHIQSLGKDSTEQLKVFANATQQEVDVLNYVVSNAMKFENMDADAIVKSFADGGMNSALAFANAFNTYDEEIRATIESAIDPFGEFEKKMETTSEQLLANMHSQIDGVTEWANMLKELGARGIEQGLLQYLASLGPQGYDYVQAFTTMTSEQLAEANALYTQQLQLDENAAATIQQGFITAGMNASLGYANGINPNEANQRANALGQSSLTSLMTALDEHSPSKKTHQIGVFFVQGLVNGIKGYSSLAYNTVIILGKNMVDYIQGQLKYSIFYEMGHNLCRGLANGISDYAYIPCESAREMAHQVAEAAIEAFDIHSPSRVFRKIGNFLPEGLAIGVTESTGSAIDSVKNMSESMIDTMNSAISHALDILNGEVDTNPVIKPILDLSDIQNGGKRLNSLLNSNTTSLLASDISARMSGTSVGANSNNAGQTTVNNVTFNQTNNSPKSLSRYEIYRQTQNQLSSLKGALT